MTGKGITFEGVPLHELVDRIERREIAEVAIEESKKFKSAIISNIRRRPKTDASVKVEHGRAKTYTNTEIFGYLLEKGAGVAGRSMRAEFRRFPTKTQSKMQRLFEIIKMLPDNFVSNEIKGEMHSKGVGDYQRYLLMLHQGEFLVRHGDKKKLTYDKTDIAKLADHELAREIMARAPKMYGYATANPELKKLRIVGKESDEVVQEHIEIALDAVEPDGLSITEPNDVSVVDPWVDQLKKVKAKEMDSASVFAEMASDYERMRRILPDLEIKDFLIVWIKGSGKI